MPRSSRRPPSISRTRSSLGRGSSGSTRPRSKRRAALSSAQRREGGLRAMARYNFQESETRWQAAWRERGTFHVETDPSRPKYYVLEMFPCPSGKLHVGHVRNYTMGDMVARYKRAQGFNVLHPMGGEPFGLPAENAAIAGNAHPAAWTYDNIATMRSQL